MFGLRGALPISNVRVDFFLVREVKCESSMHLLERQCWIALDHALRRHSLAEEVTNESRDTRVSAMRYGPSLRFTYSFGINRIVTRLQLERQLR